MRFVQVGNEWINPDQVECVRESSGRFPAGSAITLASGAVIESVLPVRRLMRELGANVYSEEVRRLKERSSESIAHELRAIRTLLEDERSERSASKKFDAMVGLADAINQSRPAAL